MSAKQKSYVPLPESRGWQLEFAHLFVFPLEHAVELPQRWWLETASEESEDFVSKKSKNMLEERGSYKGVTFALNINYQRIDWLIEPLVDPYLDPNLLPTIGPYEEKILWFMNLLSGWLAKSCPPVLRLAFVAKLLQGPQKEVETYRILKAHLGTVQLVPKPNDFLLHINRRRNSEKVPGLSLNCASTWSKMNASFSVEPGKPFDWPDKCYSTVQFDINTAPERGKILPPDRLPMLFEEMGDLAIELAERGDVE